MATAKIVVSKGTASSTNEKYSVPLTLYYYGNGVSYNSGSCAWKVAGTGQTAKSGTHSFTKSTSAQKLTSFTWTWSKGTSSSSKTISASFKTGVSLGTLEASTTVTVPALAKYTVTYQSRNVDTDNLGLQFSYTLPADTTCYYGKSVTLPKPTLPNYTFAGWSTNSDGSGTKYASGTTYTITGAVTFYATWAKKEIPIYIPTKSFLEESLAYTIYHIKLFNKLETIVNDLVSFDSSYKNQYPYMNTNITADNNTFNEDIDVVITLNDKENSTTTCALRYISAWNSNNDRLLCISERDIGKNADILDIKIVPKVTWKNFQIDICYALNSDSSGVHTMTRTLNSKYPMSLLFNQPMPSSKVTSSGVQYKWDSSTIKVLNEDSNIESFDDFLNENILSDGESGELPTGYYNTSDFYVRESGIKIALCYTRDEEFYSEYDLNYALSNQEAYSSYVNNFSTDNENTGYVTTNVLSYKTDISGNIYVCGCLTLQNNYIPKKHYGYSSVEYKLSYDGYVTVGGVNLATECRYRKEDNICYLLFYNSDVDNPIVASTTVNLSINLYNIKDNFGNTFEQVNENFIIEPSNVLVHISSNKTKFNFGYKSNEDNDDKYVSTSIPFNYIANNNTVFSNGFIIFDTDITNLKPGRYFITDDINLKKSSTIITMIEKGSIIEINNFTSDNNIKYILKVMNRGIISYNIIE